jgi:hypothetical protein
LLAGFLADRVGRGGVSRLAGIAGLDRATIARGRRDERIVLDHDYPKWASGRAIPLGIYDLAHNEGFVIVGASRETPTFEVRAIRRWWFQVGRARYPNAPQLLIQADSGGANDYRKWEGKLALQDLADEIGIPITVTHFPPGASKWNPVEQRMFSLLSANWAGEPLSSYETILKHNRTTRSTTDSVAGHTSMAGPTLLDVARPRNKRNRSGSNLDM